VTITAGASARIPVPVGAAVPSLARWGLSSDADLVFRTLATFGPRTRRTLSSELGLPVRRTDDALAELRECGAAVSTDDSRTTTRIWTARRPADVVSMLRTRRMRPVDPQVQARSHHRVVHTLRETTAGSTLPSLTVPGAGGMLSEGVRYLATREMARERLSEVLAEQVREYLSMSTEQAIDAESARAAAPLDLALHQRGVQMRVLGLPPADGDPFDVSGNLINGTSYQRRESPDVPLKLMVIDRRVSLFPADPQNLERGYLEVSQPAVVRALMGLFDRHWTTAVPFEQNAMAAIVLSARERDLIGLLAAGHTDHTAAEQLRISARSVTGVMRTLMDRLGVENRFQLGLALGALRVATPPSISPSADPSPTPDQES
jgi:DNA-binding CsgD family transcriptional regulator